MPNFLIESGYRRNYEDPFSIEDIDGMVTDLLEDERVAEISSHFLFQTSLSTLRNYLANNIDIFLKRYALEELFDNEKVVSVETFTKCLTLQYLGIEAGLFNAADIDNWMKTGEPLPTHPENKYCSWQQILNYTEELHQNGKKIAIVHGSFDPPHVGHLSACARVYTKSHATIVGFDQNREIKRRKGQDRPRIPGLAGRMYEIASSPVVDKVFVVPSPHDNHPDFYKQLYKDLHITVLGTDSTNLFLPQYKEAMQELGGTVENEVRWQYSEPGKGWSSTQIHTLQNDVRFRIVHPNGWNDVLKKAQEINEIALQAGFLRDYPDGTN